MISYECLEKLLKDKGIGKTELSTQLGLSTRTIAKIGKGEKLSKRSIQKIADFLGVAPELLMKEVSDNKILQVPREEKEMKLSGGLYHELQVRMTYLFWKKYNAKENATIEDIIELHAEFEYIHPFHDDGVIIRTSQLRQAKSRLALICPNFLSQMGHEVGRRRKISYLRTEVGWECAAA